MTEAGTPAPQSRRLANGRTSRLLEGAAPICIVLAVAAAIRLVYLLLHRPPAVKNDAELYHWLAESILDGRGFEFHGTASAAREPAYPALMAVVYAIFGRRPGAMYVANTILGVTTTGLVFACARDIAGKGVALLAGIGMATGMAVVGVTDHLLSENLSAMLIMLCVWSLVCLDRTPSMRRALVAGASLGLAAHARGAVMVLSVIPLVLATRHNGVRWRQAFVVVGLSCILIVPWTARNWIRFGGFIPMRNGTSESLWAGTYVPWDGYWRGYIAPILSFRHPGDTQLEYERRLVEAALRNITDDPAGVAWIWAKNPVRVWLRDWFSIFNAEVISYGMAGLLFAAYQSASWAAVALACFAACALVRMGPGGRVLPLVLLIGVLTLMPFNAESRYHVPFAPVMYVMAAIGTVRGATWYMTRGRGWAFGARRPSSSPMSDR